MNMYLPTSPETVGDNYLLGSSLCIYTYLQNVDNKSTSLPIGENVTVFGLGNTYYRSSCAVPTAYTGSFGPNSTGWNCSVIWNTGQPYDGILPTSVGPTYSVEALARFPGPPAAIVYSQDVGGFGFTTATSVAISSSSASPVLACGGQAFRLLTPLQSGPISLKVTTDQGAIVNNGTVFVTHTVPASAGISDRTANYCLRLEGNATGYLELAANDSLPMTGSYNLTLFAGYNQGPGYQGTIPSFTLQPDTTVFVTLSVPSGEVTVVSCAQGNSCSTTTTTATTSSGG
jgi:hypothetical protein